MTTPNQSRMASNLADFLNPQPSPKELVMYEVEMVNALGYSCICTAFARSAVDAQTLATRRFPELTVTGLTTEVR